MSNTLGITPGPGRVATVVLDLPGLDRTFRYRVPDTLSASLTPGVVVRVPLRGRKVRAWVVDIAADVALEEGAPTLRDVIEVVTLGPAIELVSLAAYGAWRYGGWLRPFLAAATPERIVRALPVAPRSVPPAAQASDDAGIDAIVATALHAQTAQVIRLPPAVPRLAIAEAVRNVIAEDVLILVPELDDAATLTRLLLRRGHAVAPVPEAWGKAAAGGCIVVGTRNAAFAPVGKLGAIVVIDAHATAYVSQRAPTANATVLCVERARAAGVPCLLVSPCPTLEDQAHGELRTLSRDAERNGWPAIEVIDRRGDDPRTGLYGERLASLIRNAHADDPSRPVICVLNRTGRARLMACGACGELVRCEHCNATLSQRDRKDPSGVDELVCHQCHTTRAPLCAKCGSTRLKTLRVGVGRVKEELAALTGLAVDEVSAQSDALSETRAPVTVGTEAVLHRARSASLVVFLDFDQHLSAPRFRAGEEALGLLARAGRLVGARSPNPARRGGPGRVVLQTRQPDHDVITAAVTGDPDKLEIPEAARREMLHLPPNYAICLISGEDAAAYAERLKGIPNIELAEIADGQFMARSPHVATLCAGIRDVAQLDEKVRIEVDPVSI